MTSEVASGLVEMRIAGVWQKRMDQVQGRDMTSSVVMLEEVRGGRQLPIWIGFYEGMAMAMLVEKVEPPRPLTYAFMAGLVKAAGAQVQEVRITRIANDTFYAAAVVHGPAGIQTVDARPSDALNLALTVGLPVFADKSVLEAAEPGFQQRFGQSSTDRPRFSELGWSDSAVIVANYWQWMAAIEESRKRRLAGESST